MNLKHAILMLALQPVAIGFANAEVADTMRVVDLEEVEVVPMIRENGHMRQQPSAVTIIGQKEMEAGHITSLKSAASLVPNLFIPDYGSRLTSAIYIRGIGSRINTPAVGMYVDDIPYIDKSAFDFNFYDIERMDVLRGPQGTLYGRNTMGGLVKVYTRNPFYYNGTAVKLGFASGDAHRSISLTHYHRVCDKFAFSASGYYEGGDGFFRNDFTGKKSDAMQAGGGRIRAIWLPADAWKLDLTVGYDYTDEGAYPYYYTGSLTGEETHADAIGKITNNRENNYRRGLFNTGLNVEYSADTWQMNAITGYQNINDRMFLDQDFLADDIYTLEQRQRINTLSEEVTFKNKTQGFWQWLTGASMMYQWLHTDGPVTFYEDGVSSLIEGNVNAIFKSLQQSNPKMPTMGITLKDRAFVVSSLMDTPSMNLALFHNSTFTLNRWKFSLGLRLEYEPLKLDYYSNSDIAFDFNIKMGPVAMSYPDLKAAPLLEGKMDDSYVQLLPKFSVMYQLDNNSNIFATISKGHRSGGYNVQMFSDLIQGEMRNQMITNINEVGKGVVEKMLGQEAYQALLTKTDVSCVAYKPEYSWNYELGTHLNLADHRLMLDAAVFYTRIYDQQIARFADYGFGRMMVNAGKSESYGAELALRYLPNRHVTLATNYGYTHATFLEYQDRKDADYSGNYIPFVPAHNFSVDAAYTWFIGRDNGTKQNLTIGATYTGTGNIYWTEDNLHRQPFYGTAAARVVYELPHLSFTVWGKNIFNRHYNTFYFQSASRGFEQHGKPAQVGVDVNLKF